MLKHPYRMIKALWGCSNDAPTMLQRRFKDVETMYVYLVISVFFANDKTEIYDRYWNLMKAIDHSSQGQICSLGNCSGSTGKQEALNPQELYLAWLKLLENLQLFAALNKVVEFQLRSKQVFAVLKKYN